MSLPSVRVQRTLFVLILVHILLAVQRLPGKVYGRRADQLTAIQDKGLVNYFLGRNPQSVKVVQWLLDNTKPDSVVLYRGHWKGSLELANALLHPRMLYLERAAPKTALKVHQLPIATGTLDGQGTGTLVLASDGESLRLTLR
jgi:hypothetical protein